MQKMEKVEDSRIENDVIRSVSNVERCKLRMLNWPNPVEYVNNMYGCHPDSDDNEYFQVVFSRS